MPHSVLDSAEGDESPLAALSIIQDWQFTWPRVMARAWTDPDFKKLLLANAEKAFKHMGFESTVTVAGREVDLWALLTIKVIEAEDKETQITIPATDRKEAQYHYPSKDYGPIPPFHYNGWSNAILKHQLKMHLTIVLPPAPEKHHQAMAVVDYQAAGKVFPITFGF